MDSAALEYLHEVESTTRYLAEARTRIACEEESVPVILGLRQRLLKKEKDLADLIAGIRKYVRFEEYLAFARPKDAKHLRKRSKRRLVWLMQDIRKNRP